MSNPATRIDHLLMMLVIIFVLFQTGSASYNNIPNNATDVSKFLERSLRALPLGLTDDEKKRHGGKKKKKSRLKIDLSEAGGQEEPGNEENGGGSRQTKESRRSEQRSGIVHNEFFTTYRPYVPLANDPKQHKLDMKKKREAEKEGEEQLGGSSSSAETTEGDKNLGIDVLMEQIAPFLTKARALGCVPRTDVVPHMRKARIPVQAIKLFKRVLLKEGISLDGGKLEPGQGHPKLARKSHAIRFDLSTTTPSTPIQFVKESGDEERDWCALGRTRKCRKQTERLQELRRIREKEAVDGTHEEDEALPEGVRTVEYERDWKGNIKRSGLKRYGADAADEQKGKERKHRISATNFQAQAHVINGAIPDEPICGCVQPDKHIVKPLRWLHIPSESLLIYGCVSCNRMYTSSK